MWEGGRGGWGYLMWLRFAESAEQEWSVISRLVFSGNMDCQDTKINFRYKNNFTNSSKLPTSVSGDLSIRSFHPVLTSPTCLRKCLRSWRAQRMFPRMSVRICCSTCLSQLSIRRWWRQSSLLASLFLGWVKDSPPTPPPHQLLIPADLSLLSKPPGRSLGLLWQWSGPGRLPAALWAGKKYLS